MYFSATVSAYNANAVVTTPVYATKNHGTECQSNVESSARLLVKRVDKCPSSRGTSFSKVPPKKSVTTKS